MMTIRVSYRLPKAKRSLVTGRGLALSVALLAAACSSDDKTPSGSDGTASNGDSKDPSNMSESGNKDPDSTAPSKTADAGKAPASNPGTSTGTPARPAPDAGHTSASDSGAGARSDAGEASSGGDGGTTSATSDPTATKSSGCGKAPPATPASSIMVGSASGKYILDLPKNYDQNKAYPLVLVWHGSGVTNTAFHDYLNMHAVVGDDAILVTPECLNGGSNWPNDMMYPDALVDYFETNYCVDTKRLFTTGHSMGGMYTAMIGCQRGDKFRADAVLAAPHNASNCVAGNMAAMMSVGMSDFVATYTTEFDYWAKYGGCDASKKTAVDPMTFSMGAPAESGHCDEYGGCKAETPVRVCTFDGGHEIPNWVAGAVWSFFKKL